MSVLARQQARRHSGNLPPLEFPPAAECPLSPAHSQKTIHPSEPHTGRSARHCGRAAEQARVCRRAPGSAMSPPHGHSPWPAPVAGGAAVGQAGPATVTLVLGARSRVCNSLANPSQCAGFNFEATTGHSARWHQSQRCFLQPHVIRGLWARSVMLGSPHLDIATMTHRSTRSCAPQA